MSTFLETLPPHGDARSAAILGAIATGHLDPPVWVPVQLGPVELRVSADWLTIGGGRVPMSAAVAQAAVNALDALLPTPKIVEAIEAAARERGELVPFVAWPRYQDNSQLYASTIRWREQNISEALGAAAPGTLIAGALKDVVIAPRLAWMLDRVLIFGGLYSTEKRVQDLQTNKTAHHAGFDNGYAGGIRAVLDACLVNGQPARVSEILRDPARAGWLSSEGPLTVVRYPLAHGASQPQGGRTHASAQPGGSHVVAAPASSATPSAPSAPLTPSNPAPAARPVSAAPSTKTSWTEPAPGAPLRPGHRGPRVKQAQIFLASAGYPCDADGLFGPATEAQVKALQRRVGMAVTGVVGEAELVALRAAVAAAADPYADPPSPDEPIPFIPAYSYYPGRQRSIRLAVLHTAEIAEVGYAAENLAKWAAGPSAGVSWHYAIDNDSTIQCVRDGDTAFHAKGANADGVGIELSGRAAQGAAGWADAYSRAVLQRAARLVASLCRRHGLPVTFLDAAALQRGEAGITSHAEVTKAYRLSTHTDPGAAFPRDAFLELVRSA